MHVTESEIALEPTERISLKGGSLDESLRVIKTIVSHPSFLPIASVSLGLIVAFWPLLCALPPIWFEPDSLYSHGPIVPLLSGYIVWTMRDKLKTLPLKGSFVGLIVLLPILYVSFIAERTVMHSTLSALFLGAISCSILFIAGWKWLIYLLPATLYNAFAFPLWTSIVDKLTQPLQRMSTEMAFQLLKLLGMSPIRTDITVISLDHYTLNVAVACSGSKLTLALFALSVFFVLAYRPKIWGSALLLALVVPLALLVNGFRIALIGIVGNQFGQEVGQQFHDYGGYIALVLCMLLLRSIVRLLQVDPK